MGSSFVGSDQKMDDWLLKINISPSFNSVWERLKELNVASGAGLGPRFSDLVWA